jgi:hypothetical protein
MNPPASDKQPDKSDVDFNYEDTTTDYDHSWAEQHDDASARKQAIHQQKLYSAERLAQQEQTSGASRIRFSFEPGEERLESALTTLNTSLQVGERVLMVGYAEISIDSSIMPDLLSFLATLFFVVMILVALLFLALGVYWFLIGVVALFVWYIWDRSPQQAAFPSGLYAVTNFQVLRILRDSVEFIGSRDEIQRIQKNKGIVTLTMNDGSKMRLSIVEGQHLPGATVL